MLNTSWTDDLLRLRSGELAFDVYARRHKGILRRLGAKWVQRCPRDIAHDDAAQEVLLAVWNAVESWQCEREMSLPNWVRAKVRFRLLFLTDKALKDRNRESRYLAATGRRDDGVSDGALALDDVVDAGRRFASMIGSLSTDEADLVCELAHGTSLAEVSCVVYPERTSGGALRQGRLAVRTALKMARKY